MTREKTLPQGRLGRFARMASLGARTGASLLLSKDGAGAAAQAAEVLGTLRGLAAKMGQMASYVDGLVPEAHQSSFETALRTLRAAAPTSSSQAIRAVVEDELGAPIDRLFASWDELPFASASIGQVHRATLDDGRVVAVKVQHPGIAKAVESDLGNAAIFQSMVATLGPKKLGTKAAFDEIKTRFREELDYRLEARRQGAFGRLHDGDEAIRIPAVIDERSSTRVLTSDMAQGRDLEAAAADGDDELRRAWARAMWRFVFKGNLVGGRFNADPHPGNYLFHDDGGVVFLDFGCVQPIEGSRLEEARRLHRAALLRDEDEFRRWAARILETRGGVFERACTEYSRQCFEPIFASPYRVSRSYVRDLVVRIQELKKHIFAADDSFTPLPPGMLFLNRLQFGFYSVLARLDVEVDYADVERRFLAEAGLDV